MELSGLEKEGQKIHVILANYALCTIILQLCPLCWLTMNGPLGRYPVAAAFETPTSVRPWPLGVVLHMSSHLSQQLFDHIIANAT